ncbi:hypothetical protein [Edaphobacter flagellatus]|uniref:hypothetical protein n=1 Tax=Edaphobacter flagellatus TaxID=1933044 RepID=UPI0021B348FE|nr:hypothetical protein [Edaphobacter flagellatus]
MLLRYAVAMTVMDYAILFLAGLSLALPHIAQASGHAKLASRLEAAPRLFFGAIALALACTPHPFFRFTDDVGNDGGAAPLWLGRIVFGALGLYLLITAIRRAARQGSTEN